MPPQKNNGPVDRLKDEAGGLVGALAARAVKSVTDKVEGATGRLNDYVENPGGPGLMAAVTGAKSLAEGDGPGKSMVKAGMTGLKEKVSGVFRNGKSGGKQKLKFTTIVESVEVGVPVRLAYNQWTTYEDFPTFTKKVEDSSPDANDEEYKVHWKAQVFWSHREWEATVVDQRPDERIVWKSEGQKGHVDGVVTFHELAPNLTKIVLVMEYHPQGMFEHTGNLWRAQGRRVRLELKHFQRHVMAHALLGPDDVEGWRGVIEDGQIVMDHEAALEEEDRERGEETADETDETAGETTDEATEDEATDEEFAGEADEAGDEEEPADEEENPDGERPGGRRRAPARGGSRARAPQRARQGTARGGSR